MDLILPPWLGAAKTRFNYVDSTGVSTGEYTGAKRTAAKGGDRLSATIEFSPASTTSASSAMQRAAMRAFLVGLRGRQNRAYLFDHSYRQRGSFPSSELLTNNTFANGTTGWAANAATAIVSDRVMRLTVSQAGANPFASQAVAPSQYVPYALRAFIKPGAQLGATSISVALQDGSGTISIGSVTGGGLSVTSGVSDAGTSSNQLVGYVAATSGYTAGAYLDIPWCSLSRCMFVDNGPNYALWSDDVTNAAYTPLAMTTDVLLTAPDGTNTARNVKETIANSVHSMSQTYTVPAAAGDVCLGWCLRANGRGWSYLQLTENTGSTVVQVFFDMTSGATGTVVTGANWSNVRAFAINLGGSWFALYVVARKTNAATSITGAAAATTANGALGYTGSTSFAMVYWRSAFALSSVPMRLAQTTSLASTTGTAPTGSAMNVKGLPASTNGLLLTDDQFEVITSKGSELKIVTAALNSDAAGLGYLQFEPPLRGVPADNAPIILQQPMGRFLFTGQMVGWDNEPGILTRASADFEEACGN